MIQIILRNSAIYLLAVILFSACEKDNSKLELGNSQNPSIEGAVSLEDVNSFALNFMTEHTKLKSTLSINSLNEFKLPFKNRKLFLVKLSPCGFILLSDNKKDFPVFAFSDESDFNYSSWEKLPKGVKEWCSEFILENYMLEQDSLLRKLNNISSLWESYLPKLKDAEIIDPEDCISRLLSHTHESYESCVLTTVWDQGWPYNNYVPLCSTGNPCPAGCVAIAMGQIMKFWKFPPTPYEWTKMLNTYKRDDPASYKSAVAVLMHDIGNYVNMTYTCDGSGATDAKTVKAFKENFHYNSSVINLNWDIGVIRQNIRNGWPVIAGGFATRTTILNVDFYSDGHDWVIDGLRDDYDNYQVTCYSGGGVPLISNETRNYIEYYHMNWGHGNPFNNAWYFSNYLSQEGGGGIVSHTKSTCTDYKWNKNIIANIHP
jgi:hypothetical protein